MNKKDAISAIQKSLSRSSSTPCTWRDDRDVYIKEKSEDLFRDVIDPVHVNIVEETFSYGTLEELKGNEIFAVARSGNNWLLYVPKLDQYSLAFGENPRSLSILGFSSNDALAEWLG